MALARYLILAAFVISAGIATYFGEQLLFPLKSSFARDSIEYSIDSDLIQLKHDGKLDILKDLKKVYLNDHRLKKSHIDWNKIFSNHFTENSSSPNSLHIDLFDSTDEKTNKEDLLIIQFSLINELTKNKLAEISRTYKSIRPQ